MLLSRPLVGSRDDVCAARQVSMVGEGFWSAESVLEGLADGSWGHATQGRWKHEVQDLVQRGMGRALVEKMKGSDGEGSRPDSNTDG